MEHDILLQLKQQLQDLGNRLHQLESTVTQIVINNDIDDLSTQYVGVSEKQKRLVWSQEEHIQFLKLLSQYGTDHKAIATEIPTRTVVQVRTHAQKYYQKIQKIRDECTTISEKDAQSITPQLFKQIHQLIIYANQPETLLEVIRQLKVQPLAPLLRSFSQLKVQPVPLQTLFTTFKQIRLLFPNTPFKNFKADQNSDVTLQIMSAIAGNPFYHKNIFVQLVYTEEYDLMINKSLNKMSMNATSLECQEPDVLQLNVFPFIEQLQGYIIFHLLSKPTTIQVQIKEVINIFWLAYRLVSLAAEPFDYSLAQISNAVFQNTDEIAAILVALSSLMIKQQFSQGNVFVKPLQKEDQQRQDSKASSNNNQNSYATKTVTQLQTIPLQQFVPQDSHIGAQNQFFQGYQQQPVYQQQQHGNYIQQPNMQSSSLSNQKQCNTQYQMPAIPGSVYYQIPQILLPEINQQQNINQGTPKYQQTFPLQPLHSNNNNTQIGQFPSLDFSDL